MPPFSVGWTLPVRPVDSTTFTPYPARLGHVSSTRGVYPANLARRQLKRPTNCRDNASWGFPRVALRVETLRNDPLTTLGDWDLDRLEAFVHDSAEDDPMG